MVLLQWAVKGYRKKTPSELKRDKKRLEYYRNMKREDTLNKQQSVENSSSGKLTVSTSKMGIKSKGDNNIFIGVQTRQQKAKYRNSSVEMPRNVDEGDLSHFDHKESLTSVEDHMSPISVTSVNSYCDVPNVSSPGPIAVSDAEPGHSDLSHFSDCYDDYMEMCGYDKDSQSQSDHNIGEESPQVNYDLRELYTRVRDLLQSSNDMFTHISNEFDSCGRRLTSDTNG